MDKHSIALAPAAGSAVSSSDLFGGILRRHRQPPRVLMQMVDAGPGSPNWGRFVCAKCGKETETHTATDRDLRRGIPCETCNQPNPVLSNAAPTTKGNGHE